MTHKRGIPEPHPDVNSLQETVSALKESVESNAQNLRDRELPSTNVTAARRTLRNAGSVEQNKLDTIIGAL